MSQELQPCPFCGSKASLTRNNFGRDGIICSGCQADMRYNGVEDDGFPELIEMWNKREPKLEALSWHEMGGKLNWQAKIGYGLAYWITFSERKWVCVMHVINSPMSWFVADDTNLESLKCDIQAHFNDFYPREHIEFERSEFEQQLAELLSTRGED